MVLGPCPECGQKISSEAIACPHCGFPQRRHDEPELWRGRAVRVLAFVALLCAVGLGFGILVKQPLVTIFSSAGLAAAAWLLVVAYSASGRD